jgi:hypothetical protein
VTFRFISLSPTLKASFARRGERGGERERRREREKSFCMFFFPLQKFSKTRRSIV